MRLLLFSALLVLVTTSQASPDSRSLEQHDGESLLERETDRPYAPELFPRAALLEATPHLTYGKRDAVMVPTAQKRQNAWGGLWKRHWSDESAASQLLFTSKGDWCHSSVSQAATLGHTASLTHPDARACAPMANSATP